MLRNWMVLSTRRSASLLCTVLVLSLASCLASQSALARSSKSLGGKPLGGDFLIVPGHSIGKIYIGQDGEQLENILGPSQFSDAAMGKAWQTWYSPSRPPSKTPRQRLDIYTVRNFGHDRDRARVRQIRITSPAFKTAKHISTRSNFAAIRRAFPSLHAVAYYASKSHGRVYIYDDVKLGITFEITGKPAVSATRRHCLSILVHPKGRPAIDEYLAIHDDLVRLSTEP